MFCAPRQVQKQSGSRALPSLLLWWLGENFSTERDIVIDRSGLVLPSGHRLLEAEEQSHSADTELSQHIKAMIRVGFFSPLRESISHSFVSLCPEGIQKRQSALLCTMTGSNRA